MPKVNLGVNFIVDIWYDPCDPDPWILVEIALPCILQAIWEYLQPDWEDWIEWTTGKTWQKHLRKHINLGKWKEARWIDRFLIFLFVAEAGVQRLGWIFLVAEITANAFIRWSSIVMTLPGCDEAFNKQWGKSKTPIDGRPLNHDWSNASIFLTEQGTLLPYIQASYEIQPGDTFQYLTFQLYANYFTGEPLRVALRIREIHTGKILAETPMATEPPSPGHAPSIKGRFRNESDAVWLISVEVQLNSQDNPILWHCAQGFAYVAIYSHSSKQFPSALPYIGTPVPSRRTGQKNPIT